MLITFPNLPPPKKKVAIVTGANKGIGYGIVKGLCEKWDGDVYLTSRDEKRGTDAVAKLKDLGLNPIFHQLDITDEESIKRLRDHIRDKYTYVDILVNNAGINLDKDTTRTFAERAEETIRVNYFSVLTTCKILFPLLKEGSRVVNISSAFGHLFRIPSEAIRNRFADKNLTETALSALASEFVQSCKNGTNVEDGWGSKHYDVSKVCLSALTFIHDREYGPKGIFINCVHPGVVTTDMNPKKGGLTIEEGAKASLHLAIGENTYRGVFMWYDCTVVDWYKELPQYLLSQLAFI